MTGVIVGEGLQFLGASGRVTGKSRLAVKPTEWKRENDLMLRDIQAQEAARRKALSERVRAIIERPKS